MTKRFMGLKFRDYTVTSSITGETVSLMCQTTSDALYTGAELLGTDPENITVHHQMEWEETVDA